MTELNIQQVYNKPINYTLFCFFYNSSKESRKNKPGNLYKAKLLYE
jgi:hypothetical protein